MTTTESCAITTIRRNVKLGYIDLPYGEGTAKRVVYAFIRYTDGKLSITGVEGPTAKGNCAGSCGQIDMHYRTPEERRQISGGLGDSELDRLFDIWHEWHLNDLRPYDEHQKELGWDKLASRPVRIQEWRLKSDTLNRRSALEAAVKRQLIDGEQVQLTPEMRAPLGAPFSIKLPEGVQPERSDLYHADEKHAETKTLGWITPAEHPDGLLTKPCPVCGYKYGTAWKRADVPQDALEFLRSLPDCGPVAGWER